MTMEATETTKMYPDLKPGEETTPMDQTEEIPHDEKSELMLELQKTDEEIATLKQVLAAKENYAADLRKKLGLTALDQISQSLKTEINKVQSSAAYKKTSDTLKTAGKSTATAISSLGTSVSQKFTDMKNSPTFKSFEERIEGVGSSIMAKVSGTSQETTPATTPGDQNVPTEPVTKQPEPAQTTPQ